MSKFQINDFTRQYCYVAASNNSCFRPQYKGGQWELKDTPETATYVREHKTYSSADFKSLLLFGKCATM